MCQFNTLRKLILAGVVAAAATLTAQAQAGGNIQFGGSNGFNKGFGGNGFNGNGFNGKNFGGNGFNNGFNNFKGNGFNNGFGNGFKFSPGFGGPKFGIPYFPTNGHFHGPIIVPHKNHFHVIPGHFHF